MKEEASIKVAIVDDHELFRQGLSTMLESEHGIDVIGSFGSPEDTLLNHSRVNPDVFLLDIKMPELNGFELASSLKSQNREYKIILLSMEVNHSYIKRAISEKVDGYIPKNSNIDVVIDAIKTVVQGEKFFDGYIKDYMFHLLLDNSPPNSDLSLSKLSEREISVLRLLVDGKQNKDIANILFISTKTVETHRNNILKKLKINSTADLVKFAIAKGLTKNPYSEDDTTSGNS